MTAGFRVPVAPSTLTHMSLKCLSVLTGKRVRIFATEYNANIAGTITVSKATKYDSGAGVPVAVGTLSATPWTTNAATTHLDVEIEATEAGLEATFDDLLVTQ